MKFVPTLMHISRIHVVEVVRPVAWIDDNKVPSTSHLK